MSQSILENSSAQESLLQQLGGESVLASIVGAFYFNILRDARVKCFFVDVDVDAVRRHQQHFLAAALGNGESFDGRSLYDTHRWLIRNEGLNHSHLVVMTEILATTLAEYGIPSGLRRAVVEQVAELGDDLFSATPELTQSKE